MFLIVVKTVNSLDLENAVLSLIQKTTTGHVHPRWTTHESRGWWAASVVAEHDFMLYRKHLHMCYPPFALWASVLHQCVCMWEFDSYWHTVHVWGWCEIHRSVLVNIRVINSIAPSERRHTAVWAENPHHITIQQTPQGSAVTVK